MIIDIWKPIRIGSGKNKKITHYEIYEGDIKTGYIARYVCDKCNNGIKSTTTSSLVYKSIKNRLTNLDHQICRSCRSRISEYEIKKTQVPFNVIKKSLDEENYFILTEEKLYNNSNNKSQLKIESICPNNHKYFFTWNNWSKNRRCGECKKKRIKENSIKYKFGFELYHFLVWSETKKNYNKFESQINPNFLKRGREYHLDHIYSIYDGFANNIPPYIISHKENLRIIDGSKNISKGKKSNILIEELCDKIFSK